MYIIYNKNIVLDLYSLCKVVFVPNDCMVQYFCIFTVSDGGLCEGNILMSAIAQAEQETNTK